MSSFDESSRVPPRIFSYNEIVSEVVHGARISRRNGLIYNIVGLLPAKSALTIPTLTIPVPQTQHPLLLIRSATHL
jgi:hypothetical protein